MKFERGKLYRVVKSFESLTRERRIYKLASKSLPLPDSCTTEMISIDTKQTRLLENGDIFMFLQPEFVVDISDNPRDMYLIILFQEAVWTTNSPWSKIRQNLVIERVA